MSTREATTRFAYPGDASAPPPQLVSRRLLSGGIWASAGTCLGGLAAFASNALVTRLLPPGDAGTYFLIVSVVLFGSALAQLGLRPAVVKLVAEAVGLGKYDRAR